MAAPSSEPEPEFDSLHNAYATCGPDAFYRTHGHDYRNPHEPIIHDLIAKIETDWRLDFSNVLDLAAGSGEVTLAIRNCISRGMGILPMSATQEKHGQDAHATIRAIDPYTAQAYRDRTGNDCESLSFEQIAAGALRGRSYSLIACSFAMHLVEESRLPMLAFALAEIAPSLLILTPHKRPVIKAEWGWTLTQETVYQRVRARLYSRT